MEIIVDRLHYAMEQTDTDQSELARRVGCTPGAINQILAGTTRRSKFMPDIAEALGVTIAWLRGGPINEGGPNQQSGSLSVDAAADHLDAVMVPLYHFAGSMGSGSIFDGAVGHEAIPFKKSWLRSHVSGRLDEVIMIYGRGDSMKPTIEDGDVLMIDRSQTVVEDPDLIWAFSYGNAGYVKRLRRLPKGGYTVQSDNKVVGDFHAADEEINILGRVVSILRWQ